MSVRELYGMTYRGWEIRLPFDHRPKELTREVRAILEDNPEGFLHAVSCQCDCDDVDVLVYTVVVAS